MRLSAEINRPFHIWGKTSPNGLPAPFFHRQLLAACGSYCGKLVVKM
jgi:hypothetical protein